MLTIITEISLCIHFCLVVKHILWLLIGANNIQVKILDEKNDIVKDKHQIS